MNPQSAKEELIRSLDISSYPILFIVLLLLFNLKLFPQTDSTQFSTETILDDIFQETETEEDNEELYGIIEDLLINPIDINSADLSEMQRIPGLTNYYASLIINHRKKFGEFFSVNELNMVEELPQDIVEKIKPFITVKLKKYEDDLQKNEDLQSVWDRIVNNSSGNFRSRIVNDLQERRGFAENKYEGSRPKIYNRFLANYGKFIDAALVAEKDAGEKSFNEFTSFHLALRNYGVVKTLLIGDYTLEYGQGLALWSPFGFSKSSNAIYSVKHKGRLISPYKSTIENNFFRGIAASVQYYNFLFSSFYSNNYFDANIDSVSNMIYSTPIDGYHRTESEISKRKAGRETLFGGGVEYITTQSNLRIGVLYYLTNFSNSFFSPVDYELNSDKYNYFSLYYDVYFGSVNIFGESSFDQTSVANLAGINISLSKDFTFITSVRNYPFNYKNIHGFGFGEKSGDTRNEFGIYTGINWRTLIGEINFYYDQFKFPFSTFGNPLPSNGNEFLFDLKSKPFRYVETIIRYKYEKKEVTRELDNLKIIVPRLKQSLRGEVSYYLSKQIKLRSRFELNSYQINKENIKETGAMIFQDIRFSPLQNLNLDSRIIFFQTDSFNSAVYEFENDLTGTFSNTALYGKGIRWYILLKYRIWDFISLSAKYSETYKPLEQKLSSGLSEIRNNVDNKISFQIDVNF